jgi:hypothetical protein
MPAIRITDLDTSDKELYFIDTNIWILALSKSRPKPDNYLFCYLEFFERIIEINELARIGDPVIINCNYIPKIAVTSLLLSEIINTYLRQVAMPAFFKKNDCKGINFKGAYRDDPNSDHNKQLAIIIDDLCGLYASGAIKLIDDEFSTSNPFEQLKEMPPKMDFNDYIYFKQFKKKNIPIVTNDADFSFSELVVITNNNRLLRKF